MTGNQTSSVLGSEPDASHRVDIEQRLTSEGLFQSGQAEVNHTGTGVLVPSATAPPFPPVPTYQGVVTSFADAEWLLVRTAARVDEGKHLGFPSAYLPDQDDQHALASALGESCDLPAPEILSRLAPQIAARVEQMKQGPAVAAGLGHEHGGAGIPPYCDLNIDGDSTALMTALGETEALTDANHPYRLALVVAYVEGYREASARSSIDACPARLAANDFPLPLTTQNTAPTVQGPLNQAKSSASRQRSSSRRPTR